MGGENRVHVSTGAIVSHLCNRKSVGFWFCLKTGSLYVALAGLQLYIEDHISLKEICLLLPLYPRCVCLGSKNQVGGVERLLFFFFSFLNYKP